MINPNDLENILTHIANGGGLLIMSYTRPYVIRQKNILAWRKHGRELLREDGENYRISRGKGSEHCFRQSLALVD